MNPYSYSPFTWLLFRDPQTSSYQGGTKAISKSYLINYSSTAPVLLLY